MKATKGYYSLYLYCDILLLADVFETFVFVFFELTSFNLEWNASYDKNLAWTYFRCRHFFVLWKGYQWQSFLDANDLYGYSRCTCFSNNKI